MSFFDTLKSLGLWQQPQGQPQQQQGGSQYDDETPF